MVALSLMGGVFGRRKQKLLVDIEEHLDKVGGQIWAKNPSQLIRCSSIFLVFGQLDNNQH